MILSVVVLTGFALRSGAELQTHTNTFIAIPNDRIRCLLYDWGGLRKMTLRSPIGMWKIHLISMFSRKGPPVFSVREPSDRLKSCFSYNFSVVVLFSGSDWKKKKSFVETFSNTNPGIGDRALCLRLTRSAHTGFLLSRHRRESERKGRRWGDRGGEMEGFWAQCFKCLFPSTHRSSSSAHARPHGGPGSTLLMMAERTIGYAPHRRKPFRLALIPSGSFTFWRIEKNELKIKIISLIWLHLRFMAAAFKGNWKKPTAEFTSVPFLVFQYFINVTSKVNLWGH